MAKDRFSGGHAGAYFARARAFQVSAARLLEIMELEKLPVRDPIYFLYAHAVELALKACIRSKGLPTEDTHAISEHYRECRALISIADPNCELHNLVALLEAGDGGWKHRYRYPGKSTHVIPDLAWVREAVDRILTAVEPHVTAWVKAHPEETPPSDVRLAFGKPTYTRKPVPKRNGP